MISVPLILFFLSGTQVFGLTSIRLSEVKVLCKPSPPKGEGVFAAKSINKGTFVCFYQGELLTTEQEVKAYPNRFPDYCLQISPGLSIDGKNSGHWSRLINHDENGNLILHTNEQDQNAYFTAARDIDQDEELTFDYGVAYFAFRQITPAKGTDSRKIELATESLETAMAQASPATPTKRQQVEELMEDNSIDIETKRATLMRSLDFFGGILWMDKDDMVEIPVDLKIQRKVIAYSTTTIEEILGYVLNLCDSSERDRGRYDLM